MIAEFLSIILYFAHPTHGITVKIDGLIDLGPKWNYEYHISTNNHSQQDKLNSDFRTEKINKTNDDKAKDETKLKPVFNDTKQNDDNNDDFYLSSMSESNETSLKGRAIDNKMLTQSLGSIDAKESKTFRETMQIKEKNKQLNKTKPSLRENKNSSKRNKTDTNKIDAIKESFSDHENFNFADQINKNKKQHKRNRHKFVTTGHVSKEIYRARKVKEDTKIHDFTVHIFKQTLKVFDDIKKKTNNVKMKRKVSALKRSYEARFSDFLKQTYNHTIKTNLGTQKVILNTIDTSNKLLQRLINHLLHDMDREILRTNIGTVNVFQKEVDKEKEIENKHACKKLGVCKLNDDLSDFLVDVLTVILQADGRKTKQAADALTEALKNADFDGIMHEDVQNKLKKSINEIELWDSFKSRAMFMVMKNIIKNRNKPIMIMAAQDNYLANKTIALLDIINVLNEKLSKADNEKEWERIKNDIVEWKAGEHNNATVIAENLMNHLLEKGLRKLDYETLEKFNGNMKVLLAHIN